MADPFARSALRQEFEDQLLAQHFARTGGGGAEPEYNQLTKGIISGTYGMGQGLRNFAGMAGDFFVQPEFAQRQYDAAAELAAQAQRYAPRVQSYQQVLDNPTWENAGDYAAGVIGQAVPSLAVGLVPGMLAATPARALLGAAAAYTPIETGDAVEKMRQANGGQHLTQDEALRSLATGGASALTQSVVPGIVGRKLVGAAQVPARSMGQALARNAYEIPLEGAMEGAGEAIKQVGATPNAPLNWGQIKENFVAGMVGGAPMAGLGAAGDYMHGKTLPAPPGAPQTPPGAAQEGQGTPGGPSPWDGVQERAAQATAWARNKAADAAKAGEGVSELVQGLRGDVEEQIAAARKAFKDLMADPTVPPEVRTTAEMSGKNLANIGNRAFLFAAAQAQQGATQQAAQPKREDRPYELSALEDDTADRILGGTPLGDLKALSQASGDDALRMTNESETRASQWVKGAATRLLGHPGTSPEERGMLSGALNDLGNAASRRFVAGLEKAVRAKDKAMEVLSGVQRELSSIWDDATATVDNAAQGITPMSMSELKRHRHKGTVDVQGEIKRSDTYSGFYDLVKQSLAPKLAKSNPKLLEDPIAMQKLGATMRIFMQSAASGHDDRVAIAHDAMAKIIGADATYDVAAELHQYITGNDNAATQRFFHTLNTKVQEERSNKNLVSLIQKYGPNNGSARDDATAILAWARGDMDRGAGGGKSQFFNQQFRSQIAERFGEGADAILAAAQREMRVKGGEGSSATRAQIEDDEFGADDSVYNEETGGDASMWDDLAPNGANEKLFYHGQELNETEGVPKVYDSADAAKAAGKGAVYGTAIEQALEKLRTKHPEANVFEVPLERYARSADIQPHEYFDKFGTADLTGKSVIKIQKLEDTDALEPHQLRAMRGGVKSKEHPDAIEVPGRSIVYDGRRVANVMHKSAPDEWSDFENKYGFTGRLAQKFAEGIAKLSDHEKAALNPRDTVVIGQAGGRDVTWGEARSLLARRDTAPEAKGVTLGERKAREYISELDDRELSAYHSRVSQEYEKLIAPVELRAASELGLTKFAIYDSGDKALIQKFRDRVNHLKKDEGTKVPMAERLLNRTVFEQQRRAGEDRRTELLDTGMETRDGIPVGKTAARGADGYAGKPWTLPKEDSRPGGDKLAAPGAGEVVHSGEGGTSPRVDALFARVFNTAPETPATAPPQRVSGGTMRAGKLAIRTQQEMDRQREAAAKRDADNRGIGASRDTAQLLEESRAKRALEPKGAAAKGELGSGAMEGDPYGNIHTAASTVNAKDLELHNTSLGGVTPLAKDHSKVLREYDRKIGVLTAIAEGKIGSTKEFTQELKELTTGGTGVLHGDDLRAKALAAIPKLEKARETFAAEHFTLTPAGKDVVRMKIERMRNSAELATRMAGQQLEALSKIEETMSAEDRRALMTAVYVDSGNAKDIRGALAELNEKYHPDLPGFGGQKRGVIPVNPVRFDKSGRVDKKAEVPGQKNPLQDKIDEFTDYLDNPPKDFSTARVQEIGRWAGHQVTRLSEAMKAETKGSERLTQLEKLRGEAERLQNQTKAMGTKQEGAPDPKVVAAKKAAFLEKAASGDEALIKELGRSNDAKGLQRAVQALVEVKGGMTENHIKVLEAASARLSDLVQDPDTAYSLATKKYNRMATKIHQELGRPGFAAAHNSPTTHSGVFSWRDFFRSGEGNSVFGAGLYLSTAEGVFKFYKDMFTAKVEKQSEKTTSLVIGGKTYTRGEGELVLPREAVQRAYDDPGVELSDDQLEVFTALARVYLGAEGRAGVLDIVDHGWGLVEPVIDAARREPKLAAHRHIFDDAAAANTPLKVARELLGVLELLKKEQHPQGSPEAESAERAIRTTDELAQCLYKYSLARNARVVLDRVAQTQHSTPGRALQQGKNPSYLVSVDIDQENLMDWDAKYPEQSETVKRAMLGAYTQFHISRLSDTANWDLQQMLREAAEAMYSRGFEEKFANGDVVRTLRTGRSGKLAVVAIVRDDFPDGNRGFTVKFERSNEETLTSPRFKGPAEISVWLDTTKISRKIAEMMRRSDEQLEGLVKGNTGGDVYEFLAGITNNMAASDWFQARGVLGHTYNAAGGADKQHRNYVIFDDSKVHTNYVHFSAQASGAQPMSAQSRAEVLKYIHTTLGDSVMVAFKQLMHSGEFYTDKAGDDIIQLSVAALNPMSVAYHESLHALFAQLRRNGQGDIPAVLMNMANSPQVMHQLRKLLANEPEALKQLSDPEERAAYAYQFWAAGQLTVSTKPQSLFERITAAIRELLGIWSNDERALHIMDYFSTGEYAKNMHQPSAVRRALMEVGRNKTLDKVKELSQPLTRLADTVLAAGSVRIREFGVPSLTEVAERVKTSMGDGREDTGFIPASRVKHTQVMNTLAAAIGERSDAEIADGMQALISGGRATTTGGKVVRVVVRKILDDMHAYMTEAGVKVGDLGLGKDYYPRVYDVEAIQENRAAFVGLLHKYGYADTVADTIVSGGSDSFDVVTDRPGAQNVKQRVLTRIPNAELAPFLNKNLMATINSYVSQGARRAEWARRFGDDNKVLEGMLDTARTEGATDEQIEDTRKYLRGVNGTLGDNINPTARRLMGNMIVYQNVRLLSTAIFSSLIDPMGILVNGGSIKDAARTFIRGIREIPAGLKGDQGMDAATELAAQVGVIDHSVLVHTLSNDYTQGMVGETASKINAAFFRYNMMERYTQSMRVGATTAAMNFLAKHAQSSGKHSARYLSELGVRSSDIVRYNDRIATSVSEGLTAEQEVRVRSAINQWVDGAVLRPDAADKPVWMNDPHFALIAHLKQFVYAFSHTIIDKVIHEAKHGNYAPAASLVSYVPFMVAADIARDMLTNGGDEPEWKKGWGAAEYLSNGVQRAGLLGVRQITADAASAWGEGARKGAELSEKGAGVWTAALGPAYAIGELSGPTVNQFVDAVAVLGGQKQWLPVALHALPANTLFDEYVKDAVYGGADED